MTATPRASRMSGDKANGKRAMHAACEVDFDRIEWQSPVPGAPAMRRMLVEKA